MHMGEYDSQEGENEFPTRITSNVLEIFSNEDDYALDVVHIHMLALTRKGA